MGACTTVHSTGSEDRTPMNSQEATTTSKRWAMFGTVLNHESDTLNRTAGASHAAAERKAPPVDPNSPEVRLIRWAQEGDTAAFTRLMDLYRERIYRLAMHMVGNSEDAHDLCQEIFVRVYRSLGGFDRQRAFTPWIYRIANNVIIDHFRHRKSRPALAELNPEQPFFEDGPDTKAVDPQQNVIDDEVRKQVRSAIQSLPENYRSVVVFRYVDDLSYAEIAEALDLTEANVMMRMSRARRMLREKLQYLQAGAPV